MGVQTLDIQSRRQKPMTNGLERFRHRLADFQCAERPPTPAEEVFNNPHCAPYIVDLKQRRVILAEVPDGRAIARSAFFSDSQYEQATRFFIMPFPAFLEAAMNARNQQPARPRLHQVTFTPRSGSTLLMRALAHTDDCLTLSEPICLLQIEQGYAMNCQESRNLYRAVLSCLLCFAGMQGAQNVVLKPFMCSSPRLVDDMAGEGAKKILLYRDPQEVCCSLFQRVPKFSRLLFRTVLRRSFQKQFLRLHPMRHQQKYRDLFANTQLATEHFIFIVAWLLAFQELVKVARNEPENALAMDYRTLADNPRLCMEAVLEHLGLECGRPDQMLAEFEQDSQRGTVLSQKHTHPLSKREKSLFEQSMPPFMRPHMPAGGMELVEALFPEKLGTRPKEKGAIGRSRIKCSRIFPG